MERPVEQPFDRQVRGNQWQVFFRDGEELGRRIAGGACLDERQRCAGNVRGVDRLRAAGIVDVDRVGLRDVGHEAGESRVWVRHPSGRQAERRKRRRAVPVVGEHLDPGRGRPHGVGKREGCRLAGEPRGQPERDLLLGGGGAFPNRFEEQAVVAGLQAQFRQRVATGRATGWSDVVSAVLD